MPRTPERTEVTRSPERAAAILRAGGIVAFPTETVYGLGADATNVDAVRRIFVAKRRPADNPLIVHLARKEDVHLVARSVSAQAQNIIHAFFPGPLTVILARSERVPKVVAAGLNTVAVRMPSLPVTRSFLTACRVPVAAPSANLSGRPSPTTWKAVLEDLGGQIDGLLQGPRAEYGVESTVIDCTTDPPTILRTGAIALEALQEVVPEVRLPDVDAAVLARSPGTRHRHYAPRARVELVAAADDLPSASERTAYLGLHPPGSHQLPPIRRIVTSVEAYAHALYDFFRACDREGVVVIYCEAVPEEGLGRAVMDRLRRAAAAHHSDENASETIEPEP